MSEAGDEKPVGPNGHGAILEGPVVFTPEQAARLEEIKRLDQTFIERFRKLRAEKAERLLAKAPPKTEDEKLSEKAEADLVKWPPGRRAVDDGLPLKPQQAASADATSLERLTYVPGLVGDIIEWNIQTARFPSRVMA